MSQIHARQVQFGHGTYSPPPVAPVPGANTPVNDVVVLSDTAKAQVRPYGKRAHIKDPGITFPELIEKFAPLYENGSPGKLKLIWNLIKHSPTIIRFQYELFKLALALPKSTRKRVLGYCFSTQIFKDFFNKKEPGLVFRKMASFAGPPFGKACQQAAQTVAKFQLSELEARKTALQSELKTAQAELKTALQAGDTAVINEKRLLLSKLNKENINVTRDFNIKRLFGPMLSEVPPVDFKEMKPELDKVLAELKTLHPGLEIKKIHETPIGSGTIAQCYRVELSRELVPGQGTEVAVKVFRPDVDAAFVKQYDDLLYRGGVLIFGKTEDGYVNADMYGEANSKVLVNEIAPKSERELAEKIAVQIKKHGSSIRTMGLHAATDRALVMQFMHGDDLSKMPLATQRKVLTNNLHSVLQLGLYKDMHLDPHSGNIKYLAQNLEGGAVREVLGLVDYGRGLSLKPEGYQKALAFMEQALSVEGKDFTALADDVKKPLREAMQGFFVDGKAREFIAKSPAVQEALFAAARQGTLHPLLAVIARLGEANPAKFQTILTDGALSLKDLMKGSYSIQNLIEHPALHLEAEGWMDAQVVSKMQAMGEKDYIAHLNQVIQQFESSKSKPGFSFLLQTPTEAAAYLDKLTAEEMKTFLGFARKDLRLKELATQGMEFMAREGIQWIDEAKRAISLQNLATSLHDMCYGPRDYSKVAQAIASDVKYEYIGNAFDRVVGTVAHFLEGSAGKALLKAL